MAAASDSVHVPVVHTLRDVYADTNKAQQRYSSLTAHFVALYGSPPDFYARAPGRVNLIGEHVDYCGYSVLPMAIDRDTVIAARVLSASITTPSSSSSSAERAVQLANYDAAYPAVTFHDSRALFTIADRHQWTKYLQCGFRGVFSELKASGEPSVVTSPSSPSSSSAQSSSEGADADVYFNHHALQLLVHGTVPPSAGLSSSSSLVCASALTAAYAHGFQLRFTKAQLADVASRCERFVGTMGGGMDQAISFLSQRGVAQRIDFDPLSNTAVRLPPSAVFVVCNSLFESEKAVQAARQFNARVLECKLAALLLAKHFGMTVKATDIPTLTLKKVQQHSGLSTAQLAAQLQRSALLHSAPYTPSEVESALGLSLSSSLSYNANFGRVLTSPPPLQLQRRALHVYSEAQRVFDFQAECGRPGASVAALGRLMDESHASCRDAYDCSCDDLERLVRVVKAAGAQGCRLTGAGWGGCVVALFDGSDGQRSVDEAMDAIRRDYYQAYKGVQPDDPRLSEYMFTTIPSTGAAVFVPEVVSEALSPAEGVGAWARRALVMVGLGVVTGLVLALLTRRTNRGLAHATGLTTSHTIVGGGADAAIAPAPSMPIIR